VSAEGLSGVSFHVRRCPQGGRLCTLQENPHFLVPTIKVRPPDGMQNLRELQLSSVRLLVPFWLAGCSEVEI
jgi:hypothetical protein